jgi:hypothetical protein
MAVPFGNGNVNVWASRSELVTATRFMPALRADVSKAPKEHSAGCLPLTINHVEGSDGALDGSCGRVPCCCRVGVAEGTPRPAQEVCPWLQRCL